MDIKRAGSQASTRGNSEWFSGTVRVDPGGDELAIERSVFLVSTIVVLAAAAVAMRLLRGAGTHAIRANHLQPNRRDPSRRAS
jgi:hypothetical protein